MDESKGGPWLAGRHSPRQDAGAVGEAGGAGGIRSWRQAKSFPQGTVKPDGSGSLDGAQGGARSVFEKRSLRSSGKSRRGRAVGEGMYDLSRFCGSEERFNESMETGGRPEIAERVMQKTGGQVPGTRPTPPRGKEGHVGLHVGPRQRLHEPGDVQAASEVHDRRHGRMHVGGRRTDQRDKPALRRVPGDALRLSKFAVVLREVDENHLVRPERVGDQLLDVAPTDIFI